MTHCNIHFRVKFFTNFSESVVLLGNIEALGAWDNAKAIRLKTTETLYPCWQTEEPIKVASGTKLEFKFAIMKDGYISRWENLPLGENRSYRPRYYLATLEFSEAVVNFCEDVTKRFISSASLESKSFSFYNVYQSIKDLDDFKRVKKGKKMFNPFANAQDSLSSDSCGASSGDKFSSDDLNSFGVTENSPFKDDNMDDPEETKTGAGAGAKLVLDFGISSETKISQPSHPVNGATTGIMKTMRGGNLGTMGTQKTSDLETLLANGGNRADVLSLLYHRYKKQKNLPKNKPTCLINCDSDDDQDASEIEDQVTEYSTQDKVIYTCFKLPVTVTLADPEERDPSRKWNITLNKNTHMNTIYRLSKTQTQGFLWIGWAGVYVEDENDQKELTEILFREYNCIPIFLNQDVCNRFLHEYCNQFLHDAFFNILDMKTVFSQESYVQNYNEVNQIYTQKILEYADLNSLIIIQDYHLMMVPMYLCIKDPKYAISYIFETPFPTLEVMKVFYNKKELIESILCCDLVCFSTSEYVKMFTNISTKLTHVRLACERGGHMYMKNGGRKVYIRVAYPSVDPNYIKEALSDQSYIDLKNSLQEKYASKTLIVGIAHFTKIEGIECLIQAVRAVFESEKNQTYHFCLLKFEDVYKYDNDNQAKKAYLNELMTEVANINESMKQKGLKCEIEILDSVVSEQKKLALMEISKLLIAFSPYLDNDLHILEYLFTKQSGVTGSIILSEFSHGHKHLNSLIKVNPFNKIEIIEGIKKGLLRNNDISSYLLQMDRNLITNFTAWDRLHSLLTDIKKIQSIKSKLTLLKVSQDADFKLLSVKDVFKQLNSMELLRDFKVTKKKVIICSYEGTLVLQHVDPKKNNFSDLGISAPLSISPEDMDIIRALSLIPDVALYIVSSKKIEILAREFDSVPNATLLAENGFYYRIGRQSQWFTVFQCDWSWKSIVQRIMQNYANRTEGVKVEVKESSIKWDHEDVRTEIAKIQETELVNHLTTVLTHVKNLEIIKERKSIEVKPAGISKGLICELIMEQYKIAEDGHPDFILCLGATLKDEEMFAKLKKIVSDTPELEKASFYTCTTSLKPSNAKYFVRNIPELYEILRVLVEN